MLIAVLEDDRTIASVMRAWFATAGYQITHYASGKAFRSSVPGNPPDLAIIDRMLEDDDGIAVTKWFRAHVSQTTPVLFASSLGAEQDIVDALDAGADDYLVKPLRREELLAKVRSLTRCDARSVRGQVTCGPVALDASNRTAMLHGARVALTDREYEVALFLMTHRGQLITRGELLRHVWRTSAQLATRTVDQHVSRLRHKLQLRRENGFALEAVYNHGYRLTHESDKL